MNILFYLTAIVALIATLMVITRLNVVHALLYLVVSLLAVALIFYLLGAPFAAALEIIIYAGAIMVLFVFVVMLLNLGPERTANERRWLTPGIWVGPSLLAALLLAELLVVLSGTTASVDKVVESKQVGMALFGPYLLAVELASLLLLGALVAAFHIARRQPATGGSP
jgi:NADH-quinone oxidoreductase subunit J